MQKIIKIQNPKNLENPILDHSFAVGFTKIRQLARFLQPIEIYQKSDLQIFRPISLRNSLRKWGKNPKNMKSDFTFKIVTFDVDH